MLIDSGKIICGNLKRKKHQNLKVSSHASRHGKQVTNQPVSASVLVEPKLMDEQ